MAKKLTDIVDAIRTKDYAVATESIARVMQGKIEERLAQERIRVAKTIVTEGVLREDRKPDVKVVKAKGRTGWDIEVNGEVIEGGFFEKDAAEEAAEFYRHEKTFQVAEDYGPDKATPGKCAECGKPAKWYHERLGKRFCDACAPDHTMKRIQPIKEWDYSQARNIRHTCGFCGNMWVGPAYEDECPKCGKRKYFDESRLNEALPHEEPTPAKGQYWKAADGSDYGYVIDGPKKANGEVPVLSVNKGKLTGEKRTIDAFKLTYRYSYERDSLDEHCGLPHPVKEASDSYGFKKGDRVKKVKGGGRHQGTSGTILGSYNDGAHVKWDNGGESFTDPGNLVKEASDSYGFKKGDRVKKVKGGGRHQGTSGTILGSYNDGAHVKWDNGGESFTDPGNLVKEAVDPKNAAWLSASGGSKKPSGRIDVECQECGKKFKSAGFDPKCPKCGGHDVEPA